jgi:hypothetical protein
MSDKDDAATVIGCVIILLWFGWIAFVIWAIVTVINWLVTK